MHRTGPAVLVELCRLPNTLGLRPIRKLQDIDTVLWTFQALIVDLAETVTRRKNLLLNGFGSRILLLLETVHVSLESLFEGHVGVGKWDEALVTFAGSLELLPIFGVDRSHVVCAACDQFILLESTDLRLAAHRCFVR